MLTSINFALHKIKPSSLIAAIVKSSFKKSVERFVEKDGTLSFMNSVKRTPEYSKQTLHKCINCDQAITNAFIFPQTVIY